MIKTIDLNADVGEGSEQDEALFAAGITSANVACGGHAGDLETMAEACARCLRHGVALGAHPGFADREHFGRREQVIGHEELDALLRGQIVMLQTIARRFDGLVMRHVKPHGALYHQLDRDAGLADRFAREIRTLVPGAAIFGPPKGELRRAAGRWKVEFVAEGFIDRGYRADGAMVPRGEPGACLESLDDVVAQAVRLAGSGDIGTLCVHGDGAQAARFLAAARLRLVGADLRIEAPVPGVGW